MPAYTAEINIPLVGTNGDAIQAVLVCPGGGNTNKTTPTRMYILATPGPKILVQRWASITQSNGGTAGTETGFSRIWKCDSSSVVPVTNLFTTASKDFSGQTTLRFERPVCGFDPAGQSLGEFPLLDIVANPGESLAFTVRNYPTPAVGRPQLTFMIDFNEGP